MGTLFNALPLKPEAGKWTLYCPCLDWTMFGLLCGGILRHVLLKALGEIRPSTEIADIAANPEDRSQQSLKDLSFHQVCGLRVRDTIALVGSKEDTFRIIVSSIGLEAVRVLTYFFLTCSKTSHDPNKPMKIHQFLWPASSPLVMVMQYISFIVSGASRRLVLLWQTFGCASFEEFWETQPELANFAECLFLMVAALLEKRLGSFMRFHSSQTAQLCDQRVSLDDRISRAEVLRAKRSCCVGAIVERLVQKPPTVGDVFGSKGMARLQAYSWGLSSVLSVADMERLHRVSKSILVSKLMDWTHFTAVSMCRQQRGCALRAAWQMRAQLLGSAASAALTDGEAAADPKPPEKKIRTSSFFVPED